MNGVRLGGRRGHVRDPARRARLLERVFAPIAERYGREPAVAGWDLMNEPEWATLGVGTLDPRRAVSRGEMRTFLAETAAVFRARVTQPLSVGLASARWLSLVDGLDLDQLQVHWYESLDPVTTLARPVATLGLGRPLLLGEFPTRGRLGAAAAILEIAARSRLRGCARVVGARRRPCHRRRACHGALSAWCARTSSPSRGPEAVPVYRLDERLVFPPPERGPRRGPIAVGGDLRPERLLLAYSHGHLPLAGRAASHWHSPDPRMVLLADEIVRHAQPPQDDAKGALPRHARHRVHGGDDRLRDRPAPRAGRHLDHARDGRVLHRAAPPGCRALRRGLERRDAGRAGSTASRSGPRSSASRCSRSRRDASKVAFVALVEQLGALGHPARRLPGLHPAPRALRRARVAAARLPRGARRPAPEAHAARALAVRRAAPPPLAPERARRPASRRSARSRASTAAKSARKRALDHERLAGDRVRERQPPERAASAGGPARRRPRRPRRRAPAGGRAPGGRAPGACAR